MFRVLLFVLLPATAQASEAIRDTIILDGQTIYIEKKEVVTDVDSLQEAAHHDLRKKDAESKIPFVINVFGGINITRSKLSGGKDSFVPLDEFLERNTSTNLNTTAGIEFGAGVFKKNMGSNQLNVLLFTGIGLNKIRTSSYSLDETAMNQDSLIQLNRKGEGLELIYFDSTGLGPPPDYEILGELRTIDVNVSDRKIELSTLDIPLKLRFQLSNKNSTFAYFADAGVVYRKVSVKSFPEQYLVNSIGEYLTIEEREFNPVKSLVFPQCAIGCVKSFSTSNSPDNLKERLSAGALLQIQLPAKAINTGSTFSPSVMGYQALVFVGLRF